MRKLLRNEKRRIDYERETWITYDKESAMIERVGVGEEVENLTLIVDLVTRDHLPQETTIADDTPGHLLDIVDLPHPAITTAHQPGAIWIPTSPVLVAGETDMTTEDAHLPLDDAH